MNKKLSITDRNKALKKLKGWQLVKGKSAITKTFQFKDFNAAFSWMTAIALYAEKLDHHPEWFNVYNRVIVTLSTHNVGGISKLDIKLAKLIDKKY